MRKLVLPVLLALMFVGCEKKETDKGDKICCGLEFVKATIVETSSIDCGKPVLDFSEDSVKIRSISGFSDLKYILNQLPAELNVVNKKLNVAVLKLPAEEEFACLTIGINYRHLKFISGGARQ